MTEPPESVRRALETHSGFEPTPDPDRYRSTTTVFDAIVELSTDEDATALTVDVRVPMLDEVTVDPVADVVEDGWYETFSLRVADSSGVTTIQREQSPSVRRSIDDDGTRVAAVEMTLSDVDPQRGVDDAVAIIDFIEGTYLQGVIPGYAYTEPVTGLIATARSAAGSDGESIPPG